MDVLRGKRRLSLVDYGRLIVRRGWIVVLLAVIAAASAYLFSRSQPQVFRASQTVLIQPSRTDNGLTLATTQILNPLVAYLNSSFRAQQIIDTLQMDMLAGTLLGATEFAAVRDNLTVQITVDLPSCETAIPAARAWGELLVQYRNEQNQTQLQQDRVNALLQDNPSCGLNRPNVPINTVVGALLGAAVGLVLVFVLEYLESSIVRGRGDIERELSLPVLSVIPAAGKGSE